MPTKLTTAAIEQSTFAIVASFVDENGDPVTPNNDITWTLTDAHGVVINDRADVEIAPGESVTILLTGDDLQIVPGRTAVRKVAIRCTYDSTLGTGLPLVDEVEFRVIDVAGVSLSEE